MISVAPDYDNEFHLWRCHCGAALDKPISGAGTVVRCPRCSTWYRYEHAALRRWPGDVGVGALEPRIIAFGEDDA